GEAYKEPRTDTQAWVKWVKLGYLKAPKGTEETGDPKLDLTLPMYVNETPPPIKRLPYKLPVQMDKPFHQPHLENFFDAIHGRAKLNCPAEIGYETAVAVLKVNEAVEAGRKLSFQPEEFKV
ncbi:MAG: Gfo/Idh/MocA family protein, partial [Planctomycetota bacterium]